MEKNWTLAHAFSIEPGIRTGMFTLMISFISTSPVKDRHEFLHFLDGETEVQSTYVTITQLKVLESGFKP